VDPSRLETLSLFSGLSDDEREQVDAALHDVRVEEGDKLCNEGEFAYQLFVIEEGTAEVTSAGQRIAELGPGECFGEVGVLVTGKRTASVTATSPMRLLAMFDRDVHRLEREVPGISDRLRSALSERPWVPAMTRRPG
jgi:CRP-like cAMP-binding protein